MHTTNNYIYAKSNNIIYNVIIESRLIILLFSSLLIFNNTTNRKAIVKYNSTTQRVGPVRVYTPLITHCFLIMKPQMSWH